MQPFASPSPKIAYRKEIDGLRSIAVVPVVLFHAGFPHFQGGFIGVDIFFVISGYLITSLICTDLDRGRFTLVGFYERRIRRILPALFPVLFFCMILSAVTINPNIIDEVGRSTISVITFISNIYFWQSSGYFGSVTELTPLLHTWSLSVEEQFYVFFPIFLSIIWFMRRRKVFLTLLLIAILSLALSEWGYRYHEDANFFLAPTRAWELLAGALAALVPREQILHRMGSRIKEAVSLISLLALIISFFIFNSTTPHPSIITLLPVLGTVGIIMFCSDHGIAGSILSNKCMVGIGLISYSLYLWHQPIFVFARILFPDEVNQFVFGFLSASSLGIAYLSWRYIEQPFRNRQKINRQKIFTSAAVFSFIFLSLGGSFVFFHTVPLRALEPENYNRYKVIDAVNPKNRYRSMAVRGCHLWSGKFTTEFRSEFDRCSSRYGKAVFITGGSNGMDLYNSIALNSSYPFIVSISRGFCRAHKMIGRSRGIRCHYEDLEKFAIKHADSISVLFYTQVADRLFNTEFGKATTDNLSLISIKQVVTYLSRVQEESGVKVAIIGLIPPLRRGPSTFDFRKPLIEQVNELYSPRFVELTRYADNIFREQAEKSGITYISKMDLFELQLPEDILIDNRPTFSDARHLSHFGELYFGRKLVRHLTALGYLQ